MKRLKYLTLLFCIFVLIGCSNVSNESPYLKNGNACQLIVDGEPFLMLAGELHNSTCSTFEYAEAQFAKLKSLNLNSVIASIAWEQFEPVEGNYNFQLVDDLICLAEKNDLKLAIIWFASWKNGQSSYVPLWVKQDTERFFRIKTSDGSITEIISPFCEEAKKADARAFTEMMKHIKRVDRNKTVIIIQPENEVGAFQDIDYNDIALDAYASQVPDSLTSYLAKNNDSLQPLIKEYWNGETEGTWQELFGDNPYSKSILMTWQYASYIGYIAAAGRAEYDIPMYVNAWLVQYPGELPGKYPNGGPVSDMMDIYKAAAPSIDICSPDIYLPNFKEVTGLYKTWNNPLLIPECTLNGGKAFYSFAEKDAICFSPFGIEDAVGDVEFAGAYQVLSELSPLILKYQGTGKMRGILKEGNEKDCDFIVGDYHIYVHYDKSDQPCYGLIINTSPDEFVVAGMNLTIRFSSVDSSKNGYIAQVWEGSFQDNEWKGSRLMNGDETYHNEALRVYGRTIMTQEIDQTVNVRDSSLPYVYSPNTYVKIPTPGIYMVKTYFRTTSN